MATLGNQASVLRAKPGEKGAAGRYTLLTEVARGYLGSLWIGRDSSVEPYEAAYVRHVAPLVSANVRETLLAAASWAKTSGVSDELEIVEGRTSIDIVSPYVDAEPFRSLLRTCALKHTAPPADVLCGIAKDLLSQIAWLNGRAAADNAAFGFGGVHPDSVLVGVDGSVHVLDLGVSAAASTLEPFRGDPQRVGYFAPEQADARRAADARTDVFALGVILWEALANRRLFPGNDAKMAREKVLKGPILRLDATRPTGMPAVATEVADVVARALERDEAARFQTVEEMERAFDSLDCATPSRIGEWVLSLAEPSIAKRRQILERAPGSAHVSGTHQAVVVETAERDSDASPITASPESGERPTTPMNVSETVTTVEIVAAPPESVAVAAELVAAPPESVAVAAELVAAPPESVAVAVERVESPAVQPEPALPGDAQFASAVAEKSDDPLAAQAEEASPEAELESPQDRPTSAPPPPSMRQALLPHPAPRPSLAPKAPPRNAEAVPLPPATEQLASPIHTTELASLTAPPKSDGRKPAFVGIAALVSVVALGFGWWIGRPKPTTDTPPVSEAPAKVAAPTPAEPVKEVAPEPAKAAAPEPTVAAAPRTPPIPPVVDPVHDAPAPAAHAGTASTSAEASPRRSTASHSARNSGYKPGGI